MFFIYRSFGQFKAHCMTLTMLSMVSVAVQLLVDCHWFLWSTYGECDRPFSLALTNQLLQHDVIIDCDKIYFKK